MDYIKFIAEKHKMNSDDINQVFDFERVGGTMFLHYSIDDMEEQETVELPEEIAKDFIESIFFVHDPGDGILELRYAQ